MSDLGRSASVEQRRDPGSPRTNTITYVIIFFVAAMGALAANGLQTAAGKWFPLFVVVYVSF
jgi:hypothetical protein